MAIVKRMVRWALRASMAGQRRGQHVTRWYMYRALAGFASGAGESRGSRVLSVSHSEDLCACLGLANADIVPADYPEHDLLNLGFPDNSFDWVVADQVLEHVAGDPDLAVEEVRRVLKPGGVMVMTSCLMNPVHNEPGDFWRFTPYGLQWLTRRFSSVLTVDGWGNPYVFMLLLLEMRFDGVPESRWHPVRRIAEMRHPGWLFTTWVAARK